MLSLYGFDAAIRSVYTASCQPGRASPIENVDDLRRAYLDFFAPAHAPEFAGNYRPIVADVEAEEELSHFFTSGDPGDREQKRVMGEAYSSGVRAEKIALVERTLDDLMSLDEDLRTLFELVIHSIIVRPHSDAVCFGGSNSAAIGLIWLSAPTQLCERDLAELLLHELTHHLLYIDELSHPQFIYDDMLDDQNFVSSAIFGKSKSVSKVFHSIIVGVEICSWRQRFGWGPGPSGAHPSSHDLLSGIHSSYTELMTLPRFDALTTPHSRSILRDVIHQCRLLDDLLPN